MRIILMRIIGDDRKRKEEESVDGNTGHNWQDIGWRMTISLGLMRMRKMRMIFCLYGNEPVIEGVWGNRCHQTSLNRSSFWDPSFDLLIDFFVTKYCFLFSLSHNFPSLSSFLHLFLSSFLPSLISSISLLSFDLSFVSFLLPSLSILLKQSLFEWRFSNEGRKFSTLHFLFVLFFSFFFLFSSFPLPLFQRQVMKRMIGREDGGEIDEVMSNEWTHNNFWSNFFFLLLS